MENVEINIFNQVQKVQVREAKQAPTGVCNSPSSLGKIFASIGKKALFFTSVPFYWLVFFTKILNFFDMRFFVFVVVASIILSFFGKNWGLLNILLK